MTASCPLSAAARSSCWVCQPVRAARTASRTLLRLRPNQRIKSARGELGKITGHLLETGSGGALLECVHRGEVELCLAVPARRRAIQIRIEFRQLRPLETNLTLAAGDERQVARGIVFLECRGVFGSFVNNGDDRRGCAPGPALVLVARRRD